MGIATFLRSQLDERGWSQKDLADRAGMQPGSLTYIMKRDHIVPQLETLDALANALDLPLAQLIGACGFEVSRPGDRYLTADDAGLLAQITDHPDIHHAVKALLKLPAAYQRMVCAFIRWAGQESIRDRTSVRDRTSLDELRTAVPDPAIMGRIYEETLREESEIDHKEIQELKGEIEKLREAVQKTLGKTNDV